MRNLISVALAASVLAIVGCRENQSVDRNSPPVAVAEVQDYELDIEPVTPTQPVALDVYRIALDGVDEVDVVLDATRSTDADDAEIVEYIWISVTEFPDGRAGRYIPEEERLTQEEIDAAHEAGEQLDAWPMNGSTTTVTLTEQRWWFHVFAKDEHGAAVHLVALGHRERRDLALAGGGDPVLHLHRFQDQ